MATNESLKEVKDESKSPDKVSRERSKIVFPYMDMDYAISIAKGVHTIGGSSCQVDQLAAQLQQPASGSKFQVQLNTARIFGLVMYSQGTVTLTALGTRICDPQQERAARVESFLSVPLYKAVYEQFKGTALPPPSGLDATMVTFGVAAKQKETARRTFQRSATQAGFFEISQDRLVSPSMKGSSDPALSGVHENQQDVEGKKKTTTGGDGGNGGDGTRHPLIEGLIKTLPAPDTDWPIQGRLKWLQAASKIFSLIYKDAANDETSLSIEIKKGSA